MTSESLNRYNFAMAIVEKNVKIHVFLKKASILYLVKHFWAKNGVFGDL
jgi:hypothetical protein